MAGIFHPQEVLNQLEIQPASVAADFGSGSGYFVLALAKKIGEKGRVYAIDVLPTALESIRSLAKLHGFSNIETRWANLEKTSTLDAESCDFVLISNLFFQVEKKYWPTIIQEAFKILKSGGQLLMIDWKPESVIGPPKEQRVREEEIKKLAGEYLSYVKNLEIGDSHWAILFKK